MTHLLLPGEARAYDDGGWARVMEARAASLAFDSPDNPWISALVGGGNKTEFDRPFLKSVWIYACVHAIAQNLSSLPLRVYRGPEEKPEQVATGPLVDLVRNPQPRVPRSDHVYRKAMWLLLRGESFELPLVDGEVPLVPTMPTSLAIVPPKSMQHEIGPEGRLAVWRVVADGGRTTLRIPPTHVVQAVFPNPYDAWRGLAPVEVAYADAEGVYQADQFNSSFLKNGANPGGVYSYEKRLSDPQRKQVEASFKNKVSGPLKAGETLVLDDGAKFTFNPQTHRDMQFLEGKAASRDAICAVFSVPKSVVSVTEAINYATKLSDDRVFWTRAVLPVGNRLCGYFNAWLASIGVPEWIAFDPSAVEALQDQLDEKMKVAEAMQRLGYTADEINNRLGLRLPTGPKWRGVAWLDPNKVPSSTALTEPEAPIVDAAAGGATAVQDTAMNGAQVAALQSALVAVGGGEIAPEAAKEMLPAAFPALDKAAVAKMVDAQAKLVKPPAAPAAAPATPSVPPAPPVPAKAEAEEPERRAPFGIRVIPVRSDVRANARGFGGKVVLPNERKLLRIGVQFFASCRRDALAAFNSRAFTAADMAVIEGLESQWDDRIRAMYGDPLRDVVKASAEATASEIDKTFDLDLNDPKWLRVQRDRLDKLVGVNDTTIERVRSTLVKGLADGLPTSDLRKSLEAVFDGDRARALNVARTEVGTVASSARDETYGELGIEKTEWLTANDDVVRDSHRIDGEIAKRGEKFSNGLHHPHDPAAGPDEVCGCRCDHVAVL